MKHYAMVAVVEVEDDVDPVTAWEATAQLAIADGPAVYLGDPYRVPEENQGSDYATQKIVLNSDAKDHGNVAVPFTMSESALEEGPV